MSALTDAHKNSKKVEIHRSKSFISRVQNSPEVEAYYSDASTSIGGYWAGGGARATGTGLLRSEETLLMPDLVGLSPEDREFRIKVKEFFDGIDTKIPATRYDPANKEKIVGGGLQLEIGLEVDNDAPLSSTNMPLSVTDFIKYRHALGHPFVAPSREAAEGNPLKKFYIHNPIESFKVEAKGLELEDEALGLYLEVANNAEKVKMLLTLLDVDFRDVVSPTEDGTKDLRKKTLRSLVQKDARKFISVFEDKDFEVKYTLKALVNTNILKQVGKYYIIAETGTRIGDEDEAILFFKDEATNSQTIGLLKAKLQEGLKVKKAKRAVRS